MRALDAKTLDLLWHDEDDRETRLRTIVADRLGEKPSPRSDDHVVATYFFALRTLNLSELATEIVYHATSGIRKPPAGSLLAACTGKAVGIDAFDASERIGLLHMAYPLKMLLDERD